MPDQNNPTDSNPTPAPVDPVSEPTQMPEPPADIPTTDVPPFPPEPAPIEGAVPADTSSGSAAPSFDIPPVVTPPGKPKKGGRKVIATILGLLVLVGGLGAGVILVRQQQDIRERAAGPGQACTASGVSGTCTTASSCNAVYRGAGSGGCTSVAGTVYGCCTGPRCYQECIQIGNTPSECRNYPSCSPATTAPTTAPTQAPACIGAGQCLPSGRSCCSGLTSISTSESTCSSRRMCITSATTAPPPACESGYQCQGIANQNECVLNRNGIWQACSGASGGTGVGTCCVPSCTSAGQCLPSGSTCCSGLISISTSESTCSTRRMCVTSGGASPSPTSQTCRPGWYSGGSNRDGAEEACINRCGFRNEPAREGNCNWENRGTGMYPNWCYQCVGTAATTSPAPTSPPGGGPSAQCLDVKAYDTNWTQLTVAQLAQLRAGDRIRFTVAGTSVGGGSIDRARFRINGVQRPEVTQKKPGTEEYYDEYIIPSGTATFTIHAQIHHTTLGWSN